ILRLRVTCRKSGDFRTLLVGHKNRDSVPAKCATTPVGLEDYPRTHAGAFVEQPCGEQASPLHRGGCIQEGLAVQDSYSRSPSRSWTIAACLAVKKRVRSAWDTLWNWVRSCRRRRCIGGLFQGGVVRSHATYRRASSKPSAGVWSAP